MKKSITLFALLLMVASALAKDNKDNKDKSKEKRIAVDAGSFSIYLNGKRIGTEKFNIEQDATEAVVNAEITVEDGTNKSEQSSELRFARAGGELRVYKWRSTLPTREESTVEPKEQLLVEHITTADQKKHDVPYILPLSTVILDDNFFSQRELLIWRYLYSGCIRMPQQAPGQPLSPDTHYECPSEPAHFGILVPHQHSAGSTSVGLLGRDKITFKGTERELNKVQLDTDGVTWFIWIDDNYKVLKMAIPASNVEVWRD